MWLRVRNREWIGRNMKLHTFAVSVAALCGVASSAFAADVVRAPALPKAGTNGALVGFVLHNPNSPSAKPAAATVSSILTFGQVFAPGVVKPTDTLYANDADTARPVQMDVLATNPDGSVRFAAITTAYPQIVGGTSLSGTLALGGVSQGAPVNLATLAPKLTVKLAVTNSPFGAFNKTVDLGAALQAALASGKADFWLHGPLATQVRVDVVVAASLHITADITGYQNGQVSADVQFNNDLAMLRNGGTFAYTATVTLNGTSQVFQNINQDQYQDWHTRMGPRPIVNVQHDVSYLESAGAILPYDLANGVASSTIQSYSAIVQSPGFGKPLAENGITTYMPMTGGRPDIGYSTQFNTVWLVTQNETAANVALAQGDTGGAVPWNMKLANGHWLTPAYAADIWVDPRGGPSSFTTGLTQQTANTTWTPDPSHQPDLAYVPYLMTGERWYLDRLNAQAAFDMTFDWPGARCLYVTCTAGNNYHVINQGDQVRQQAWSMREIEEAGWIGPSTSFEAPYFAKVAHENWGWFATQTAGLTKSDGQTAGWIGGAGWAGGGTFTAAPWQQDFFDGVTILAARMGDTNAPKVLNWEANFMTQRFLGAGMNPHDGCASDLALLNSTTFAPLTTWASVEAEQSAAGYSNGTGWANSQGYYCSLALATLGGLQWIQPTNANAKQAYDWLNGAGAPYTSVSAFQADPTYDIVPPR